MHRKLSAKLALFSESPFISEIRDKMEPADDCLDLWMAASTLPQYKGIRFLEQLQKGDIVQLKTSAEGGHLGQIYLRFVEFEASRRATRSDKLEINRKIQAVREEYYDLREQYYSQALNEEPIETVKQRFESAEAEYQKLHQQRGQLEGIERNMKFNVEGSDAWQKFRPVKAYERDLGERLKEACVRDCFEDFPTTGDHEDIQRWREEHSQRIEEWLRSPDDHTITKETVRAVC
jgi:DNA-binding FrmR family transcriptional regulator